MVSLAGRGHYTAEPPVSASGSVLVSALGFVSALGLATGDCNEQTDKCTFLLNYVKYQY